MRIQQYRCVGAFTLVEILVVTVVIAILISILLPALSTARGYTRQAVCGSRLHSLGQGMQAYCSTYNDWFPGSPNTSGNGANPGGWRRPLYDGSYYVWDENNDAWPAIHIFDWATPMLEMMNTSIPMDIPERYDQSKRWAFLCPSHNWIAKLNHTSRINIETIVSSYATCRYFTYIPVSKRTGISPGTLFWAHPFVPESYMPRITSISAPSTKVFLADACKVDRGNPRRISNQEYGYSTHGAWLNLDDVESDYPSLSYRFEAAKRQAYRHSNGINMLFFDGHIEYQPEGSSEANNGFGTGSRQLRFWFPSGTKTSDLPSGGNFSNPHLIVP